MDICDGALYFEAPGDAENICTISAGDDGLYISVADEHVVDSYNASFECTFEFTIEQARLVRDYLVKRIP